MLIFLALFLGEGEPWYPVDEMNVRLLGPSGANGRLILLSNFGRHNTQLTLFDFGKAKAKTLHDGRLQVRMARPVPYQTGFAILGTIGGVVYFVNDRGEFLSRSRLNQFDGWEEGMKIKEACPGPEDTIYLILTIPRARELLFGELNLSKKAITLLYNRPADEQFSQAWVTRGNHLYFYNKDTAQIDLVDWVSFKPIRNIQPAMEPVKKEKVRARRKPYRAFIEDPIQGSDRLFFRWNQYRDQFGNDLPERRTLTLVPDENGVDDCNVRPYGSYENRSLVFDWHEGEFRLLDGFHPCSGHFSP